MRIQHNISVVNTNRFLGMNQKLIYKNTEKLSSGYRINRAGDDAAGLSISEKMRNRIRGLNQATKNIEDGISLIQTAEGALNETHSILARMRELSVQAANDTNAEDDRAAIQAEIGELVKEVDDIAYKTKFNDGIWPLLGGGIRDALAQIFTEKPFTFTAQNTITVDDKVYNPGDTVTVTALLANYVSNGKAFHGFLLPNTFLLPNESETYQYIIRAYDNPNTNIPYWDRGNGVIVSNSSCGSLKLDDLNVDENGDIYYMLKWAAGSPMEKYDEHYPAIYYDPDSGITYNGGGGKGRPHNMKIDFSNLSAACVWIQSGANQGDGLNLSMVDATALGLGLKKVNVMSNKNATNALGIIDGAVKKVSGYRSAFGAQQSRLERAVAVNNNNAENLQASESKIRDTDMPDEIVRHSKQDILLQVGQAMLAQVNNSPQAVLKLLQ